MKSMSGPGRHRILGAIPAALACLLILACAGLTAEAQPPAAADFELVPPGLILPRSITLGKVNIILTRDRPAKIEVNGKPLTVSAPIEGGRVFIFALPVNYSREHARITIEGDGIAVDRTVAVIPHENSVRDVPSIVLPDAAAGITTNKENQARIAAEDKLVRAAIAVRSAGQTDLSFAYPLAEPLIVTSGFGKKRNYYDARKKFLYSSYHLGIDYRAAKGAPVLCTAAGTVLLARSTLVRGNAVYVDHGLGIISAYMHMDRIYVEEGQRVEKGTILGGAGTTGVSTGVHLHWSVYVDGVNVDGSSLVEAKAGIEAAGRMLTAAPPASAPG